jgi:hypothetical protein|tara:strand:+ start:4705 stop:4917 length:213 start_codon:yes stop_codon:yes gene_type:complete
MAKKPNTTGEHIVALYGHVTGLKKDICSIKNNHLKHMHEDIDKTAKKIDYILGLIISGLAVLAAKALDFF